MRKNLDGTFGALPIVLAIQEIVSPLLSPRSIASLSSYVSGLLAFFSSRIVPPFGLGFALREEDPLRGTRCELISGTAKD